MKYASRLIGSEFSVGVPAEYKKIVIMEHKDQILEEIKGLSYRDLDLYYLTYNSSLPKDFPSNISLISSLFTPYANEDIVYNKSLSFLFLL